MKGKFLLPPIVGNPFNGLQVSYIFDTTGTLKIVIDDTEYFSTCTSGNIVTVNLQLNPGTYQSKWYYNDSLIRTTEIHYINKPKKIAFCSCDMLEGRPVDELWEKMSHDPPDLIIHTGDNIYADVVMYEALCINKVSSVEWTVNKTRDLYRKRYQDTFYKWADLLGGVPHLMGIDDHDIADNSCIKWEDIPNHILNTAFEVYDDYCGAINCGINNCTKTGRYWKVEFEDTQIIFSDRDFEDNTLAYRKETLDLIDNSHNNLIFVTSFSQIPPISCGIIYDAPCKDKTGRHIDLYKTLSTWLEDNSNRRVSLIGGDMHISI